MYLYSGGEILDRDESSYYSFTLLVSTIYVETDKNLSYHELMMLKYKDFKFLESEIHTISKEGEVILEFDEYIDSVELFYFDNDALKIEVTSEYTSDYANLEIDSWRATKIKENKLYLSIVFNSVLSISNYQEADTLEITFLRPYYIRSTEFEKMARYNETV